MCIFINTYVLKWLFNILALSLKIDINRRVGGNRNWKEKGEKCTNIYIR